ncbi:hypothetical protein ACQEVF_43980 [Nonomuraea polychroma]|uniref:hypothetical protein n=1 Tax=Nonomuraea polychroma TaxID=46176 RepID=UPI003D94ABE3
MKPVSSRQQRTSMRALIDLLSSLPPVTLTAQLRSGAVGTQPYDLVIRVNPGGGLVISTRISYASAGQVFGGDANFGATGGDLRPAQLGPGRWEVTVRRRGITNAGYVSLAKSFTVQVSADAGPADPPPPTRPRISVRKDGPVDAVMFTITGSGFLPGQPDSPSGIAIRAVDGVTLQEYPQVFTASDTTGAIERTWGPLNTLLTQRNAGGFALIHFSATDSRRDPTSVPANQPLWSNTVDIPL